MLKNFRLSHTPFLLSRTLEENLGALGHSIGAKRTTKTLYILSLEYMPYGRRRLLMLRGFAAEKLLIL